MKAWKMNVRSLALLGFMCCLAFETQSANAQQTFSYPDFSSTAGLTLNPQAATAVTALRLTPATGSLAGSAFRTTPIPLEAGFTTTFAFQFSGRSGTGGGADGIAFVVQGASNMALGNIGGAVGYGDDDADVNPTLAIPNSLVVEFDTFKNDWDPSNNHVAIQSCGNSNNSQHHNGLCAAGNRIHLNPTLGIIDLTGSINLIDGGSHTATINYTVPCSGCKNLTVNVDGQQVLAVVFDIALLGLDTNADAFVGFTGSTGGGVENNDVLSWNFSSQTITQPVSTAIPTTFAFSNVQNTVLNHAVDFSKSTLSTPPGITSAVQIQSTNTSVDSVTWPQYVVGGPLAPSLLFPLADNNTGGSGTNGGLFVDLCFDPTSSGGALVPSDANCPQSTDTDPKKFLGISIVADLTSKPPIAPGTTSVLAHFEPNTTTQTTWSPSLTSPNPACSNTTGTSSSQLGPQACDVLDIQQAISGDQTTSSGRSRGKGTFAFAYGVPMLLSTVSVNGTQVNTPPLNLPPASPLWFKSPVTLSFAVSPAAATPPNNNFQPAPVAGESFGILQGANAPVPFGPILPPSGFTTQAPVPEVFAPSPVSLQDGQYTLEWSAVDNVGIQEQNQQLITQSNGPCPGAPTSIGTQCYITSLFSAPLNVDSTPPTISPITFSPSSNGNIFAVNQRPAVTVMFSCDDPLVNNVHSLVATCAGPGGQASGGLLNTSTAGTFMYTVTAIDKAGNTTTQSVPYQIVGSSELLLLNLAKENVKQGSNLTYKIVVLNFGPSVADIVVVTDTLPAGTSFVSAGYGIVSCTPWGDCSDMSGSGSACSPSGITAVTCNIPTVGLVFKGFTGALVKITVNVSATPGTVLKDTAKVKAVNTDPFLGDNSATARTDVCPKTGSCQDED